MSLLLIAALAILVGNIVWGYKKGFLRVVFSLLSWMIVVAIVGVATPVVSNFVVESTDLEVTLQKEIEQTLQELAKKQDVKVELPKELAATLFDEDVFEDGSVTIEEVLEKNGALTETAKKLTMLVVNGGSFLVVFILVRILLGIVEHMLGFLHRLPILGTADKFLGILAGGLKGVLLIWILLAVVALTSTTDTGVQLVEEIYHSEILIYLYENNMVLNWLLTMF